MSNQIEIKIKELFNSIYLTKSIQDLVDNHPDRIMHPQTHFDYITKGRACIQMLMHMLDITPEQEDKIGEILLEDLDDIFVDMFEIKYEFVWDDTAPFEHPKKKGKKSKKNVQPTPTQA